MAGIVVELNSISKIRRLWSSDTNLSKAFGLTRRRGDAGFFDMGMRIRIHSFLTYYYRSLLLNFRISPFTISISSLRSMILWSSMTMGVCSTRSKNSFLNAMR
jgi:hypothetical protein